MSQSPIDTNCMTLSRFFLSEQQKKPEATGDLTQILMSIQSAVKAISAAVRRAGIANLYGLHGSSVNIQGEEVKKLDALSNELFINLLSSSYACCLLISEENEHMVEIELEKSGKYIVAFDPLDGSSNIDCLVSIGSIFAIFRRDPNLPLKKAALQNGHNIVASGYALYGSATMMVVSLGNEVNGFMLDPAIGEFILTDPRIKIPSKGKIYSTNEAYEQKWEKGVYEYVRSRKVDKKPCAARYIGSMVADVHRTIKYGGIFMYPATEDAPNGKLRIMYECFPMAHIAKAAGGLASDGNKDILDILPTGIHSRTPVFLGSTENVQELLTFIKKYKQ